MLEMQINKHLNCIYLMTRKGLKKYMKRFLEKLSIEQPLMNTYIYFTYSIYTIILFI